jgi:hypothetical protein
MCVPIRGDYQQDVGTVNTDTARRIVRYDSCLDSLSRVPAPVKPNISGLPSWAPDWSLDGGSSLIHAAVE